MDLEKARELLQDADGILRANVDFMIPVVMRDVQSRIEQALRALDGECGEEWTARPSMTIRDAWSVVLEPADRFVIRPAPILDGLDEATARRIAALPRLERAARPFANVASYHEGDADASSVPVSLRSLRGLAAALNQEG